MEKKEQNQSCKKTHFSWSLFGWLFGAFCCSCCRTKLILLRKFIPLEYAKYWIRLHIATIRLNYKSRADRAYFGLSQNLYSRKHFLKLWFAAVTVIIIFMYILSLISNHLKNILFETAIDFVCTQRAIYQLEECESERERVAKYKARTLDRLTLRAWPHKSHLTWQTLDNIML